MSAARGRRLIDVMAGDERDDGGSQRVVRMARECTGARGVLSGLPRSTIAPLAVSAEVDGHTLSVTFDEDLAPASTQWCNFQLTIDGTGVRHHPEQAWFVDVGFEFGEAGGLGPVPTAHRARGLQRTAHAWGRVRIAPRDCPGLPPRKRSRPTEGRGSAA